MRLIFPVFFFAIFSSIPAQKSELKFLLEISAKCKEFTPDIRIENMFIIKSSNNDIDTLYSSDTNTVEIYLKPELDYRVTLTQNGSDLIVANSNFSTKGKTSSTKFIEEFYIDCNYLIPPTSEYLISYDKNNFTNPKSNDSTSQPFKYFKSIFDDNQNIAKFSIKGYRMKNEKTSISFKRAEYFKKELIKMGINNEQIDIEDGGVCKQGFCDTMIRLYIVEFAK